MKSAVALLIAVCGFPIFLYLGATPGPDAFVMVKTDGARTQAVKQNGTNESLPLLKGPMDY